MLDREQITELLEARKAIEIAVLDRAFEHWDALVEDLEAAQAKHAEIISRIEASETVSYELVSEHFQADWGFHQTLYKHADNRYLAQMFESLRTHTHRMRQTWEAGPLQLDAREAYEEHGVILEKVRRHHHDAALAALTEHLDAVLERSLTTVDEG
jgi:DNA-binding GntR family transcriptional regulator